MTGTTVPRDLSLYLRIPAGEATELPPEDGWRRWDLAVKLLDPPQDPPGDWALEPMEAA